MLILRSLLFNILFYLNLIVLLLLAVPALLLPRRAVIELSKQWGRSSLWLLRVICDVKVEWRGREKIPSGPLLVAAKHQSIWETFALVPQFPYPNFVVKRELMWIPLFGWCLWKADNVPVDRSSSSAKAALKAMRTRTRISLQEGRQIIVFPEGTRRPAGAPPDYKSGIAHLYAASDYPCLPVALNSGLFWPRRKFLRHPGTIIVEFLDPIAPGLRRTVFLEKMEEAIESATTRLIAEARQAAAGRQ